MFHDTTLVNTILDRVLHHITVVNIVGPSFRISDRLEKEGVD